MESQADKIEAVEPRWVLDLTKELQAVTTRRSSDGGVIYISRWIPNGGQGEPIYIQTLGRIPKVTTVDEIATAVAKERDKFDKLPTNQQERLKELVGKKPPYQYRNLFMQFYWEQVFKTTLTRDPKSILT